MKKEAPIVNLQEHLVYTYVQFKRPPVEMRDEMDLGYRYEKNVLELFEIRQMNFDPSSKEELPVAKAKYIQTSRTWKIYCRDQNQKWKAYHHHLQISNLEDVLIIIDEDNEQCFW